MPARDLQIEPLHLGELGLGDPLVVGADDHVDAGQEPQPEADGRDGELAAQGQRPEVGEEGILVLGVHQGLGGLRQLRS